MKTVITGQALLISSFYGPWTVGIVTTVASLASDAMTRFIKSYSTTINKRKKSKSAISTELTQLIYSYFF